MRDALRLAWTWLLGVLARHRVIALAVLSTVASATVSLTLQPGQANRHYFGVASLVLVFLILLTGLTPARYAAADLVAFMLPAIHHVLKLTSAERVTIHLLISGRREKYEQLTDYYPREDRVTRGRVFTFSHGIVGQVFKTRQALCWSVLEEGVSEKDLQEKPEESWKKAMNKRWGFNEPELSRVTPGRHSFLAHPIGQEGAHARAVLFIDSSDPKRFQEGTCSEYQDLITTVFVQQLKEALRSV